MRFRSVPAKAGMGTWGVGTGGEGQPGVGRLIPIILALYLTPALLAVLLMGGVGMLVLAIARAITSIVHGPEAWPRSPVGPESPAS
jgi:hypothetical protein